MRIVILGASYHVGSMILTEKMFKNKRFKIVGFFESKTSLTNPKFYKQVKGYVRKSGLIFSLKMWWMVSLYAFGRFARRMMGLPNGETVKCLCKKRDVFYKKVAEINDLEVIASIKQLKPDLIVSCFFNQVLKKNVLSIPKIGAINLHPGWLPKFRGTGIYFWVLAKGLKWGGVTVHWMEEGLDTGDIIARKKFLIRPWHSTYKVLTQSSKIGGRILMQSIRKIEKKGRNVGVPQKSKGRIYRFPSKATVLEFVAKGKRIFKWDEIWDSFGF